MKTPFVFFAVNRCWRLLALLATLAALLLAPLAASAQANVEPYTGTSTYTIPIVTPPGTNGMGPNLALTYGSGSGDGWFGHNWGLSGLGYVERRGPQYGLAPDYNDATDTFLLNWGGGGGKLVYKGVDPGTGATGKFYRTQIDSYLKIERVGLPTDAAYYWVVTDKGGTKYFFGQTALSREFHPGPKTFRWYLDKVLDTNDVYWTVKWGHDGTTNTGLAPAQIAYSQAPGLGCNTTAGALAQCRTVDFYYKVRTTDVAINFSTGGSVSSKVLVDFIDIKLAGQMVRRHTMGYTLIDGTTARRLAPANLLTSVTEAGADLTPLPPIKFTYHTDANGGSVALNVTNYNFSPDETLGGDTEPGSCTHLVDVDGDGLTDVLVAKPGDYWWKRNIGGTFLPYQAIPSVGFPSLCNNKIDTTAVDYQLAGFNYSGYNPVTNIIYAMVNSVVQGIKIGGAAQTISPTNHSALIDIDGDGLVDIVDGSVAGTNAWTWRKNLGGGAFSAKFQLNASFDNKLGLKYVDYWGLPRVGEYRFADMDGDGLIDLLESAKFSRQFNRFLW